MCIRDRIRTRNTAQQARLEGEARRGNLRGAISADAGLVRGRRVLLIDDCLLYTSSMPRGFGRETPARRVASARQSETMTARITRS